MNSVQAKQLSLPQLLSKLGHQPIKTRRGGYELWYLSPFRSEEEPSFVTSYLNGKWIWNDFGDTGGTVIDFALRYENLNSVKDALNFLSYMFGEKQATTPKGQGRTNMQTVSDLFSFKQQGCEAAPNFQQERELEFLRADKICNPLIHNYLEQKRGIPFSVADRYLLEVKYRNRKSGKEYFAFGMQNESNGYEIRAASDDYSFKSALIKRDITLIRGSSSDHHTVNIFEGMTDFLSLPVLYGVSQLGGDAIIMHSLSSFSRTVEKIRKEDYQMINTFLDNNEAGQSSTCRFLETFPEQVQSQNDLYMPYVDLNDALLANTSK